MKIAFPPIVNARSRVLILGSMPGEASLAAGEYYAFGRNAFWKIMASLLNIPEDAKYHDRIKCLKDNGIALWDVIEQCERVGSLDSKINDSTVLANDFTGFLKNNAGIKKIYFNGKSVQPLFTRHVLSKQTLLDYIELMALPSTSPANARLSFEDKLEMWKAILLEG